MDTSIFSKSVDEVFGKNPDHPTTSELLDYIAKLSPVVNGATDKVNAMIRDIESSLSKAGACVEASVVLDQSMFVDALGGRYPFEYHSETDDLPLDVVSRCDRDRTFELWYERREGGFKLGVREEVNWLDPTTATHRCEIIFDKALTECPRDKKLFAASLLDQLLFEIAGNFKYMAEIADGLAKSGRIGQAIERN